jgi:hypothetical protein
MLVYHAHHVFATVAAAEAVATALNAQEASEEVSWVYRVEVDPVGTGKAVIMAVDEDGFDVGLM